MVQISSDDVTRGMPRGQLKRKVRLHVFSFKRRFIAEMFSVLIAFFFFRAYAHRQDDGNDNVTKQNI